MWNNAGYRGLISTGGGGSSGVWGTAIVRILQEKS